MSEKDTTQATTLIEVARMQQEQHVSWLIKEIEKLPASVGGMGSKLLLIEQAKLVRVRVVKANNGKVTTIWDYPDELLLWLRSDLAPAELRASLDGGYLVQPGDPNEPASTFKRVDD